MLLKRIVDHPVIRWALAIAGLASLGLGGAGWIDARLNATLAEHSRDISAEWQEMDAEWLVQDTAWNKEIISRLKAIERRLDAAAAAPD